MQLLLLFNNTFSEHNLNNQQAHGFRVISHAPTTKLIRLPKGMLQYSTKRNNLFQCIIPLSQTVGRQVCYG